MKFIIILNNHFKVLYMINFIGYNFKVKCMTGKFRVGTNFYFKKKYKISGVFFKFKTILKNHNYIFTKISMIILYFFSKRYTFFKRQNIIKEVIDFLLNQNFH